LEITGIVCEYNPLHLGHKKQLSLLREQFPDGATVCLMSGNFVQRGMPAVFDKSVRAEAAVRCGADLVLELPVTACLSSAEGFASEGVRILSLFCDRLCFGAESGDPEGIMSTARALLQPEFSQALREQLAKGLSFPAARQAALGSALLTNPNDILGVEYCKAILAQNSPMEPLVIRREGGYHDTAPDPENPSATAIRAAIHGGKDWLSYVPGEARELFSNATAHTMETGERAVLARLRTMTEGEFEALPHGSEGLWRKLMGAVAAESTVQQIAEATKSKRYTRTRIDRMILCAYLGITREMLAQPAPYVRVLAFNDRGREVLKKARMAGAFVNAGERTNTEYEQLEYRCGRLYGLFAEFPEAPNIEEKRRVVSL